MSQKRIWKEDKREISDTTLQAIYGKVRKGKIGDKLVALLGKDSAFIVELIKSSTEPSFSSEKYANEIILFREILPLNINSDNLITQLSSINGQIYNKNLLVTKLKSDTTLDDLEKRNQIKAAEKNIATSVKTVLKTININTLSMTNDEEEILKHIKKGDNQLSLDEFALIKDLQTQILSSKSFNELASFILKQNKPYQTTSAGPKTIFGLHSHIPLNKDGSQREVIIEGKQYKGIALLDKLGALDDEITRRFDEINLKDEHSVNEYLNWLSKRQISFDWTAWNYDSPYYGRIMQTWERAYTNETNGLYGEPKDPWNSIFQTNNANSEIVERVYGDIANQLNVEAQNLTIVNGHTPNDMTGLPESFHKGRLLRIDGAAASAYGGLGHVTLFTDKGTAYCLFLAPHAKYALYKVDPKSGEVQLVKPAPVRSKRSSF